MSKNNIIAKGDLIVKVFPKNQSGKDIYNDIYSVGASKGYLILTKHDKNIIMYPNDKITKVSIESC